MYNPNGAVVHPSTSVGILKFLDQINWTGSMLSVHSSCRDLVKYNFISGSQPPSLQSP